MVLAHAQVCPRCLIGGVIDKWDEDAPAPKPSGAAPPPRVVGEYELLEELGRGGMGIVWRARQKRLNRVVALKLVREGCLPGESAAKRFRREAEAAAAIQHPHIVTIHEVGESDDQLFLSMELVPGGSLADWMKRVAFSARDAAALLAKVARAVHHAHQQGVLHRDLKPANILLDAAGEPRVCDFGLARLVEDTSTLTVTGEVLGTPAYLSPEQASGTRAISTASDTYSLGAIMYEMLAGHPPFSASSLPQLLRAVAEDDPQRPISRVSGKLVPVDLSTICLKCLEKEPYSRYGSALALAEDLERWIRGEPILARPVARVERLWKWARRKPLLATLWLALTVLTIGVAVYSGIMNFRLRREKQAAADAAQATQHAFARSLSDSAQRYINAGDWFRALPPLADAIEIGTGEPRLDEVNRIRFGVLRRLSPVLVKLWSGSRTVRVDLTSEGTRLLMVFQNHAEVREMPSGKLVGRPFISEQEISGAAFDTHRGAWAVFEINNECVVWEPDSGAKQPGGTGVLFRLPDGAQHRTSHYIIHSGKKAEIRSRITGDPVGQALEHQEEVQWAVMLPGINRAMTCDVTGQIYIWDVDSCALAMEPFKLIVDKGDKYQPSFDAYDVESKTAVLHSEGTCWILNCKDGTFKNVPQATDKESDSAAALQDRKAKRESPQSFGADGSRRWLYMTRNNDGLVVRDLPTGEMLFPAIHGALGFRGDFGIRAQMVATQSWNRSTRAFRTRPFRAVTPFLWQAATPGSCKIDPHGHWILTQCDEPSARLWTIPDADGSFQMKEEMEDVKGMWFAGIPERLFIAEKSTGVAVWDVHQPEPRKTASVRMEGEEEMKWCGAASGGARIFTATGKAGRYWDSATGQPRGEEIRFPEEPASVVVDPTRERIAIIGQDGTIRIREGEREKVLAAKAKSAQFSANGNVLLVIGEKAVRTWDPESGRALSNPVEERSGEPKAIVSPDGSRVVQWSEPEGSGQHAARLWDSATGKVVCRLAHHWQGIMSAAFSPDGSLVATGGEDHMLQLCDARTGAAVVPPMGHPQKVGQCGFSADGLLVWALVDGEIVVWDVIVGEQVTPRLRHHRNAHFVATNAGGRRLAVVGSKGEVRLWDLRAETLSTGEMRHLAHALSAHALVPGSGALRPLLPIEVRSAWEKASPFLGVWKEEAPAK